MIVTLRRKATSDYKFSDGVEVRKGKTVYVPLRAMGRDAAYFNDPGRFNGYRFLRSAETGKTKGSIRSNLKYTDINPTYPYWGYGLDA
jgi:cytochrome P450